MSCNSLLANVVCFISTTLNKVLSYLTQHSSFLYWQATIVSGKITSYPEHIQVLGTIEHFFRECWYWFVRVCTFPKYIPTHHCVGAIRLPNMPVLSLACHLPHNTPHIPSRYNNEQTTKQTKAINNSYIYINISCKCDTNRAGHFTLDAYASRPVACDVTVMLPPISTIVSLACIILQESTSRAHNPCN